MTMDRRRFVQTGLAAGAVAATSRLARAEEKPSANETLVLAIMGTNGRGSALAKSFARLPNCEIAAICDVDSRAIAKGINAVTAAGGKTPRGEQDFRRALDDKAIDALVCAAPNHWHGPATILGCSAGKHVYVEKPCCHDPAEGEMMVAAAKKHRRVVTVGTQRRSSPLFREVIDKVRAGEIGEVRFARSWYNSRRGSIGQGKSVPVPSWLNYELWQGPAPEKPFKDNLVHYNWHWHWHWGNGELGNNGIHSIDLCRWAMDVDYPTRVTALGGRYRYSDDQETPDTLNAVFEFGDKSIAWQGLSWSPLGSNDAGFGLSLHGEKGSILVTGNQYQVLDMSNKEIAKRSGGWGQTEHVTDFLDAIRNDRKANADILEAHKSTLLCHLGNIAYRTGSTLHTDPANGHIKDNEAAAALWTREYRQGWQPVV